MAQLPETVEVAAPYQVFINHRGPDVKKTLATLIYHRLRSYGLRVFLDKDEFRAGDNISPAILAAIQSALVHVTIFSERYAESKWCLDELCWVLRSHHERNTKIIPVFADVKPSDLRYVEKGQYAQVFEEHQRKGRVSTEVIQNWKTALNQVAEIYGPLFETNESDYGEILEEIVDGVLKEVFKREALEVAKYPVGLDQAAEDFRNEIPQYGYSKATMIVGIAGMGGIGKSTLVKYLFNSRGPDFSRSSILCEVRKRDLLSLQNRLLRDLLGNYDLHHIDSTSQGRRILQDCLPLLPPIFIVLDDVDHMDQIEILLDVDAVASGSRILITSRDKDLFRRFSAKIVVYDVKPLHKRHARELFCRHAFFRPMPSEELENLVEEFLKICGGLPLSLKVFGGLFVGQCDKEYWKRQLEKLSSTLPDDMVKSLRVSYDALDPEEKEVFLDIGCFFVGEDKESAIRVLEELYDHSRSGDNLESLRQKCLLDFHYDRKLKHPIIDYDDFGLSKITMHDQLRELAIHIAREEFRVFPTRKPLRLNSSTINEFRKLPAASRLQIRGIRFWNKEDPFYFWRDIRCEGLRLLVIENVDFLSSSFYEWKKSINMSGELVWLRLRNLKIPPNFSSGLFPSLSLRRLRVLEIQGLSNSVEQFFDDFDEDLPRHLTDLNIVYTGGDTSRGGLAHISTKTGQTASSGQRTSLISQSILNESPLFRYLENWVTRMGTLTNLVLKNLGFLQSLPIDFSQLQNLRHLDLSGCSQLTELPNTFSELVQLQYLALRDCSELSIPLDILGEITTLEHVDFKGCAKLVYLPGRIPYQRHLRYLNLLGTSVSQLPYNLGMLDKLEQITIGSPALKDIPLTVANLRGLTKLFLIRCCCLHRILPEGIAAPNIKILAIDGCPIDNFSFQDQGNMDAQNIYSRVGMSFLRDLTLTNTSISQISISDCVSPRLETIDLSGNIQLMSIDALPSTLVSLNLQNCCALKTLTSLSNLANLKFLNINRCLSLQTLNIEGLESLEKIKAGECWELQRIQGLNQQERLNCLHFSTDNRVIWNDICRFLRSPTHQKPSTAIFSGGPDIYNIFDQGDMLRIAKKFDLQPIDIFFGNGIDGSSFSMGKLNNLDRYSAILICFITNNVKSSFHVIFRTFHDGSFLEYSSHTRNRGGRGIHVFMWTKDSPLFREYSVYRHIGVHFIHSSTEQNSICDRLEIEKMLKMEPITSNNDVEEERGWIVMVDEETDVTEVFGEFCMS